MKLRTGLLILSAGTMLAATAPVLASPPQWGSAYGYRDHDDRGYRIERHEHDRHAIRQPVYDYRPVYVAQPVAYAPPGYYGAPYGYAVDNGNVFGAVAGAAVGALIGNQIGHGGNRAATTAIGAAVGAALGGSMR